MSKSEIRKLVWEMRASGEYVPDWMLMTDNGSSTVLDAEAEEIFYCNDHNTAKLLVEIINDWVDDNWEDVR